MRIPEPRRWLAVPATLLVIAAGAGLWQQLPRNTDIYAAFDEYGVVGQQVQGRGLSGTVEAVTIGPTIVTDTHRRLNATGIWVVVYAAVEAGTDHGLAEAELMVGDSRYLPTSRLLVMPPRVTPGFVDRRGWVFDVAPDRLDAVKAVRFRLWVGDGRLDSRLVFDIPLDDAVVRNLDPVILVRPAQEIA